MTQITIDDILNPTQRKQLANIPIGDPVLVVLWNEAQLCAVQALNAQHTKQSIVDRLVDNGGRDPHGTKCLFHFPLANMIQTARQDFLNNAIWVMGTTPGKCHHFWIVVLALYTLNLEMQAFFNSPHPPRPPVAETYEIARISKADFEYKDARFFYF